jgi:ion channel-forming bestrophin family protein
MFIKYLKLSTSTLSKAWWPAVLMGIYTAIVCLKEMTVYADFGDHPSVIYIAVSMVLGVLIIFRTNTAYSRWWEARTLWGRLVNVSRNYSIKVKQYVKPDEADRVLFRKLVVSYPKILMHHLRSIKDSPEINELSCCKVDAHHPQAVVNEFYRLLDDWREKYNVDTNMLRILDSEIREYLEVCGGCERILKTPLSISYIVLLHQCLFVFLLTMPWGMVTDYGWVAIPLVMLESYFLIGMELLAETVEEPFGTDLDDLKLESICEGIDSTVTEIIG